MKKIINIITTLAISFTATSSFAYVSFGSTPSAPNNGKDYIGTVIAANNSSTPDLSTNEITIMTKADAKLNESNIPGGAIIFQTLNKAVDRDFDWGMVIAASVGKKIAVAYDSNYKIKSVQIITDEYWNGSK